MKGVLDNSSTHCCGVVISLDDVFAIIHLMFLLHRGVLDTYVIVTVLGIPVQLHVKVCGVYLGCVEVYLGCVGCTWGVWGVPGVCGGVSEVCGGVPGVYDGEGMWRCTWGAWRCTWGV